MGFILEPEEMKFRLKPEDIRNNENYNIYCTDELSARKFLTLRCWNGLIDKFLKMPCVYF